MADADWLAVQAVVAGQQDRFTELVDRYQTPALRIAFSVIRSQEEARDIVQDAFVQAYQALPRFRHEARFSTWLFRIVINRAKDALRARARRPQASAQIGEAPAAAEGPRALFVDVADPSADASQRARDAEIQRQLAAALDTLPDTQRVAFLLHHVHGLPLDEIAEIMDCRTGTVKSHLFRAMSRLRTHLEPWWREA